MWDKNEEADKKANDFAYNILTVFIITLAITSIYNTYKKPQLESNNLIIATEQWDDVGKAVNIALEDDGKLSKTEWILIKLLHDERQHHKKMTTF